ncbi:prevent-host-death protein [Anaerolineaceae bacterium oral taxon 439]|nr:prevent-host-death protein [Anaerolineaceae bacterium oral taxon 439]
MHSVNLSAAQKNLYRLIMDVNEYSSPITITNSKGKNAVLLSEQDWNAIQETLYLNSIPGMVDSILSSRQEDASERGLA